MIRAANLPGMLPGMLWQRTRCLCANLSTHTSAAPPDFFSDEVPAEFQMPPPPDPIARAMAGMVDLGVAGIFGSVVGGAALAATGCADAGVWSSVLAGSFAFAARDGIPGDGCGSVGKRLLGLRVVGWDHGTVGAMAGLGRNSYMALVPFFGVADVVWHAFVFCAVWDVASLLATRDARRAGDYLMGCRVATTPVHLGEASLDDLEVDEMSAILSRLEGLSPDTAAVLAATMPYSGLHQAPAEEAEEVPEASNDDEGLTSEQVMLRHAAAYSADK